MMYPKFTDLHDSDQRHLFFIMAQIRGESDKGEPDYDKLNELMRQAFELGYDRARIDALYGNCYHTPN